MCLKTFYIIYLTMLIFRATNVALVFRVGVFLSKKNIEYHKRKAQIYLALCQLTSASTKPYPTAL